MLGGLRFLTGGDMILLGKCVGVVSCLLLLACVAQEINRRQFSWASALVAFSFFWMPYTTLNAVNGMATLLFTVLYWLCALSCVRLLENATKPLVWRFVLFGLLGTLTRPEFAANFIVVTGYVWWQCPRVRSHLVRAIITLYVLPGIAVTAWRFSYYGDILPNPFYVKQDKGFSKWGALYVVRFLCFCAIPYIILIASGWRTLWGSHRHLLAVTILNVGISCLYFTTTTPTMGIWYRFLLPHVPLMAFTAAASLQFREIRLRPALPYWLPACGGVFALYCLSAIPPMVPFLRYHHAHELRYREIGKRLHPFAAADRWLAYWDVGSIVYESEWNTIDIVGLNTRCSELSVAALISKKHLFPGLYSEDRPRADVLLQFSTSQSEAQNPRPKEYTVLAELPCSSSQN